MVGPPVLKLPDTATTSEMIGIVYDELSRSYRGRLQTSSEVERVWMIIVGLLDAQYQIDSIKRTLIREIVLFKLLYSAVALNHLDFVTTHSWGTRYPRSIPDRS